MNYKETKRVLTLAKALGIKSFKTGDISIEFFHKEEPKPVVEEQPRINEPIVPVMPSDEELMFYSAEPLEVSKDKQN